MGQTALLSCFQCGSYGDDNCVHPAVRLAVCIIICLVCFPSSIGYPVVTLGFGFKSYVSYRLRLVSRRGGSSNC